MPFTPGDPKINRSGRPKKGACLTDLLRAELNKRNVTLKFQDGTTRVLQGKKALARKLVSLAVNEGNFQAIKYIIDRLDGMPKQDIEVTTFDLSEEAKERMQSVFQDAVAEAGAVSPPQIEPQQQFTHEGGEE